CRSRERRACDRSDVADQAPRALLRRYCCHTRGKRMTANNGPKDAQPATRRANEALARSLPSSDERDFEDAKRGLIAVIPDGLVPHKDTTERPVWDMKPFDFEHDVEAPPTVNPSLWRQARLNAIHGLFKVTERVYQLRGYDVSNMTIVEG